MAKPTVVAKGATAQATAVKVYNCIVRLGGNLLHTVPKVRISGEEIRLLKAIHGDDSIAEVKELGTLDGWTRDEELLDLADRYSTDVEKREGRKLVEKVFGISLNDFDDWLMQKEIAEAGRQDEVQALRAIEESATARGTLVRSGATS